MVCGCNRNLSISPEEYPLGRFSFERYSPLRGSFERYINDDLPPARPPVLRREQGEMESLETQLRNVERSLQRLDEINVLRALTEIELSEIVFLRRRRDELRDQIRAQRRALEMLRRANNLM